MLCIGEGHGQLSATVIVDQPIIEEEEEERGEGDVTEGEMLL